MNVGGTTLCPPRSTVRAVAEKRVPGWVLVVVLLVVGLVVAVPVVLLRPTPRFGPPVFLILTEDAISSSPAGAALEADFGPHCSPWRWDEPRGHLTVAANIALGGVDGLVLQHFAPGTPNFVSTGGDFLRSSVHLNGTVWRLTSPIDNRHLLTLEPSGDRVTVGNATYGPGESWTMRFAYDVDTPQGTVRITEDVTFRNLGVVESRIVPVAACA